MTIPSAELSLLKSMTICAVFTVLQPLPWAPVLPCSGGGEVLSIDRALASKRRIAAPDAGKDDLSIDRALQTSQR